MLKLATRTFPLPGTREHVGVPLLVADWTEALFLHFEVDPEELQNMTPFPIDLFEGKRAFVSLVAFRLQRMRSYRFGKATAWLTGPIANHDFLNLRTYIRHESGEPGIHFLREWLNDPIAVRLGPLTFGLPYRYGEIDYHHDAEAGTATGLVLGKEDALEYEAEFPTDYGPCERGTSDEFLLERYTAFTRFRMGLRAKFRVWHEPWAQARATQVNFLRRSLIDRAFPRGARFFGANFSPGANGVWMGRPVHHASRKFCHEYQPEI